MSNGVSVEIPCVSLPKLPEQISITVPGGATLQGFLDFSQGLPDDCSVSFNLMLQIQPLLANLTCLLKIFAVIKALESFASNPLNPTNATDLISAIGELVPCFTALTPPGLAITIKGVLELIIKFLKCFITQVESIVNFQASIDLSVAEGNPMLQASLGCAQDNGDLAMEHLMASLGPVQPLLDMVTMLSDTVGLSLGLPNLAELSGVADPTEAIAKLKETITQIETVIDTLPG